MRIWCCAYHEVVTTTNRKTAQPVNQEIVSAKNLWEIKFRKIMVGGKKQEPKKTELEMVTRRNEIEKSMWYSGLEL